MIESIPLDILQFNNKCKELSYIQSCFIEHENYKRRLMRLADNGNIHSIQWNGLGHMQPFLKILGNKVQFQILHN